MCLQELRYIVQSSVNVKTLILKRGNLVVFFDAEKLAGKPIKLVRMLVAAKAVKILDLNKVNELKLFLC